MCSASRSKLVDLTALTDGQGGARVEGENRRCKINRTLLGLGAIGLSHDHPGEGLANKDNGVNLGH